MARVAGVDLPSHKRIETALTYLYGIGRKNVKIILERSQVPSHVRCRDLTEAQISAINGILAKELKVEGELHREVEGNIRRYIEMGSYRGQRHRKNLPVHGQRTKTNARTRRGLRKTVGSAKPGTRGAPAAAAAKSE